MNIPIFYSSVLLLSLSFFTVLHSMQTLYEKEVALNICLTKLLDEWIILSNQLNKDLKNFEENKVFESKLWTQLFEKNDAIKECLSNLKKTPETELIENGLAQIKETFKICQLKIQKN